PLRRTVAAIRGFNPSRPHWFLFAPPPAALSRMPSATNGGAFAQRQRGWSGGEQLHRIGGLLLQLLEGALLRRLVRAPAQDGCAVAEALAGEMVVADFDHELRFQRTPLRRALGRPAAGAARRIAGEAGRGDQRFQLVGKRKLLVALDGGGEADMVQQAGVVVEAQQQRADDLSVSDLVGRVAEAANDAIGAAEFLDLLHAVAFSGLVGQVAALGNHAVEAVAGTRQPFLRSSVARGGRRQAEARIGFETRLR